MSKISKTYNDIHEILDAIQRGELSIAKLSKESGISATKMYKWKDRGIEKLSADDAESLKLWMNKLDKRPENASVSDSEAIYGHSPKDDDSLKIILNLSESSRTQADAALLREQNYKETMEWIKSTAGDPERMPPASEARLNRVLELLAKIGSGSKRWKSEDEARVELYKIFYGDRLSNQKRGIRDGLGKVNK